jgi:tRNA A37 threonylcarbamoyladenosine biosynthesis protein TsaE
VHNVTIKKAIDKVQKSDVFVIEDLGVRSGYRITTSCDMTEQEFVADTQKVVVQEVKQPQQLALIGREQEVESVLEEIKKRRDILLFGEIGTGKTAILKHVFEVLKNQKHKIIYADYAKSFKQFLINVVYQIHATYNEIDLHELTDKGEETIGIEWRNIKRRIMRMTTNDLAGLIVRNIKGKDYIIICDHLERITPTAKAIFETLREGCCFVGATWLIKNDPHLKKLWWRFKNIEIKNLEEKNAEKLIEHFLVDKEIHVYNRKDFIQKLLKVSKGNAASIYDMIYHAEKEKYVDRKHLRNIEHEAGRKEFDMTLLVVFLGVMVMAVRFFALGMNNKDVYIIAGISGAVFMFVRFVLTRGMR